MSDSRNFSIIKGDNKSPRSTNYQHSMKSKHSKYDTNNGAVLINFSANRRGTVDTSQLNRSKESVGSEDTMLMMHNTVNVANKYGGGAYGDGRAKTPFNLRGGGSNKNKNYSLITEISTFDKFIKNQNKTFEQTPFDNNSKPDPYLQKLA